ncbi:DUF2512 family protein [Sedimentibacter hydroxybenzoicus DSM 7310]|uniref:DUF2512 family protein n=1 Tax=Sedimentibacter hydroxybenzoicus DSM 7310 TaxID=1123245 RepID=A0A974BN44_SEDHY|nr:DUF2512 family protein [Sedimentibacter hydroxybenzoicus]NYB76033.1 DUF2512 family protein [Sedimentibacter hydroxybenzoicus DSM 7310]
MRTTLVILAKFLITLVASWVSFIIIDVNSFEMVLMVAIAGTVINYALGDLVILPSMGNVIAAVGDGILAAATAYLFDMFSYNFITSATGLIIFAAIIGTCEYFFHIYLIKDDKVQPNEFHREPPLE